ncbi:hypothetical protein niasHT_031758 [Heterodera trifolii]|uniref:Uncharacterized protein n=1 Tax=Heterodera trifolii TaxID=157864 RepID=A0ABD2IGZ0_9BILA
MTNGIISLFCFVGIFLNASLVYVTAKTTKLHTHCPLLLAFHSLTVIPVLLGITFKFLLLLSGVELVPLLRCYHFLLVGLICAGLCTAAQLAIGYDRLLSVLVPTWYKQMNGSKRSLSIMITLCFVRTAYLNANYFFAVSLRPKKLVMCCFDDIAQPEISAFIYREGLAIFVAEFVCYALIWLKKEDEQGNVFIDAALSTKILREASKQWKAEEKKSGEEKELEIEEKSDDEEDICKQAHELAEQIAIDGVNPAVVTLFTEVGAVMAKYRNGKVPKAFKMIPAMANWEQILELTCPENWSSTAMFQATRAFAATGTPTQCQKSEIYKNAHQQDSMIWCCCPDSATELTSTRS